MSTDSLVASDRPALDKLVMRPHLLTVTPLLYVAWADGALTESEIRTFKEASERLLPKEDLESLRHWLDPEAPPTSTELLRLYRFIRDRTAHLDAKSRRSLVDLGYEIAQREGHQTDEAQRRALQELEDVLGVQGYEAQQHYFADRPTAKQDFPERPTRFETAKLQGLLDGEHYEQWQRVREMVSRDAFSLAPVSIEDGMSTEERRAQVRRWLMTLLGEGWGQLAYPTKSEDGGPRQRFIKVFEALGMHDLSLVVKIGVQLGLFGGAVAALGTERHHSEYLPKIATGELLGGFAMTELGHGSNVKDIETIARFDAEIDCFVVHTPTATARKEWIGNAARDGRAMVVFAQLQTGEEAHGVHAFIIDVRNCEHEVLPGIYIEDCGHKMGLNGVDNGRIWFDNVRVPRENLLDCYGQIDKDGNYSSPIASSSRRFFTMLGTLVTGRVSIASAAVTSAKAALTTAVRYGALRRQFGSEGQPERSLLSYPCHQQRMMPHVAACYAYHFAVDDLQHRWQQHEGDDTRQIESLAAGIKALSTWQAIDGAQAAREACGGMGFLSVNRICELRKDLDVFATFEGDNIVLLQLVARSLLGSYAKELSDDLLGTVLGEIARKAKGVLRDQSPINKRRTDPEHLIDVDFHSDTFDFRAHNLLVSAARRIKKRTDSGLDAFSAATEVQDHLVALARAHTEHHIHQCFAERIVNLPESRERVALESMRALWALWRIREDIGWFVENGCFEERKARAIRKAFAARCRETSEVAVDLVNSFGLPDAVLGPIAFENYPEHPLLRRQRSSA